MIFNIIALLVGTLILGAGVYYLIKDREDAESKRIYGITTAVGAVIVIGIIIKIILL